MKVFAFIFMFLMFALLCNESVQQRRSRGPTGRRLSTGRRDASSKSVQQTEQQEEQQQFYGSPDELENNPCSRDSEQEIHKDFTKLMILGDKDFLLSPQDKEHQDEHCEDAKRNLKTYLSHVKCFKGKVRKTLENLGEDFRKWIYKRCTSQSWHDRFLMLSKCYKKAVVQRQWHICLNQDVASMRYVLRNVAAKTQLDALCCHEPHSERCQHNRTDEVCGQRVATEAIEFLWEPWEGSLKQWCAGKYDCSRSLPHVFNAFNRIYSTEAPVVKQGEFYKSLLQIIKNTYADIDE